jgi:hypothetical protein
MGMELSNKQQYHKNANCHHECLVMFDSFCSYAPEFLGLQISYSHPWSFFHVLRFEILL